LVCISFNFFQFLFFNTFFNELFTIKISARSHLIYDFIHKRLSKGRLVELIVTEFSVSNKVNNNITLILLTVLSSKFKCSLNIFHTISIDVENWCINTFCNISSVYSWSTFTWWGCETNLIINNNVNRSSYIIILKRLHLQLFKHNTLSRKCCVTMDYYWNNLCSRLIRSS